MHPKSPALRSTRRLLRARGGNVAMLWALSAAAIVGLIGLSVDFSRAQALRSEMQNAADGAALVAQRNMSASESERANAARAYFDQSLGKQADTSGLSFQVSQLQPAGHHVAASIDLNTGLSRVLNLISGTEHNTLRVAVSAEATSQVSPPIELVMALDNTGSMSHDMDALRSAAANLANSLYDLAVLPDDIKIGVVPFVAQVNIGNGATQLAWMDTAGVGPYNGELLEDRQIGWKAWQASYGSPNNSANCNALNVNATQLPYAGYAGNYRINWVYSNISGNKRCLAYTPNTINYFDLYPSDAPWKGCVEARTDHNDLDINDTPPSSGTPETLFTPFFWVDGEDTDYVQSRAITTVAGVTMNYSPGDASTNNANARRADTFNVFKYRGSPSVTANSNPAVVSSAPNSTGPNKGCPTPITPLTNTSSRSSVITAINAMDYWSGGGTDQVEGLVWGWRVLSPGQPFTQGRPYNDPTNPVRKVLVLMTDGENTNLSDNTVLSSDYSAYNHLGLWTTYDTGVSVNGTTHGDMPAMYRRNITSSNSYVSYINTRETQLCTNIKNAGIEVYTVVFREPSQTVRNMLRDCATNAQHAFTADSQAQLASAFEAIGQGVGQLRLTR